MRRCSSTSNHARIIVFGLGAVESRDEVQQREDPPPLDGRMVAGALSAAHRQPPAPAPQGSGRALDGVVRDEAIERVIVAGDAGLVARLREQLPPPLAAKIVDVLRFDRHAGEDEIVGGGAGGAARAGRRRRRRSGSPRCWARGAPQDSAWPVRTRRCARWQLGQVDELLIAAHARDVKPVQRAARRDAGGAVDRPKARRRAATTSPGCSWPTRSSTRATQTGAAVRIIEDPELLRDHGGVAAALRFRI